MDNLKDIFRDFGFKSDLALVAWSETLEEDWRVNEDKTRVLYTDGDSGLILFSWSYIYEEDGASITLINCSWCDISFFSLRRIERALRVAYRKAIKKAELEDE